MAAVAPSAVTAVPAPSAVIAVPAANPKVPVVQATISAAAAAPAVKANALEAISSILPLFWRTTSQTALLRIGAVYHGCRSPWTRTILLFCSNYGIHRSQSPEELPSIQQVYIKCLGLCSEAWRLQHNDGWVEDSAHRGSETSVHGSPGMDQEEQMDRNGNGDTHTAASKWKKAADRYY